MQISALGPFARAKGGNASSGTERADEGSDMVLVMRRSSRDRQAHRWSVRADSTAGKLSAFRSHDMFSAGIVKPRIALRAMRHGLHGLGSGPQYG